MKSGLIVAAALACAACSFNLESYPGVELRENVPILRYEEYQGIDHANPYVVRLDAREGSLLYLGTAHTTDPEDPQVDSLRSAWAAFRPTVALAESRRGWRGSLAGGVRQFGESSAAVTLARDAGIPVYTLDAPLDMEVATVLRRWSAERAFIFYLLRAYTARHPSRRSDGQMEELLQDRGRWPGFQGLMTSIAELDAVWAREFPRGPDWRALPWEATWPDRKDSWLNLVSADVNHFRDEYMVSLLTELVCARSERVFAVVGSSHVVMQEGALRAALREC